MSNCDSYLLNERALALKSIFTGDYQSEIIATDGTYFSELTPQFLLNEACLRHCSTKKGRIQAAAVLLDFPRKTPFIIVPNEIGVFPTESPKNPGCIWIFNHRFTVKEIAKGLSIITFMNGMSITVPASEFTLLKQKHRLHALMSICNTMHREKELYAGIK